MLDLRWRIGDIFKNLDIRYRVGDIPKLLRIIDGGRFMDVAKCFTETLSNLRVFSSPDIIGRFIFRASSGESRTQGDIGFDYGRLTLVRGEPLYPPIGGSRDPTGPEIRRPIIPVRRVGSKIESIGRRTSSRLTGYGAGAIPDFRRFQATGPPELRVVPYNTFRVVRTIRTGTGSPTSTEVRIVKRRASSNDGPFYVESYEAGDGWLVRGDTLDGFTTMWYVLRPDLRVRSSFESEDLRNAVGIAASNDAIYSVDEFGKLRIHRIFGGGTLREIDIPTGATGLVYSRGAVIVLYPERRVEVYNPTNGTRITLFNILRVLTGVDIVGGVVVRSYFDKPPFYSGDIIGAAPDDDTIFPNVGAYEFSYERTLKAGSTMQLRDTVRRMVNPVDYIAREVINPVSSIRRHLHRPITDSRSTLSIATAGAFVVPRTVLRGADRVIRRIFETAQSTFRIRGIASITTDFIARASDALESLIIFTRSREVSIVATRAPERDITLPDDVPTMSSVCITHPSVSPVRIYTATSNTIYEFDADGVELRRSINLGSRQTNPNRIGRINGIEVVGPTLFITDGSNDVIISIPRSTLINGSFGSFGSRFSEPQDLARVESDPGDPNRTPQNPRLFAADSTNRMIQPDGGDPSDDIAVDRSLGLPQNLAWFDGDFYVGNGARVFVYNAAGERQPDKEFTLNEASSGFAQHGTIFYSLVGNRLLAYTFRKAVLRPTSSRLTTTDAARATLFQGERIVRNITDSTAVGVVRESSESISSTSAASISKLETASTAARIREIIARSITESIRDSAVVSSTATILDTFAQDLLDRIRAIDSVIYQTDMERIFTRVRSVERNIQVKTRNVADRLRGSDSTEAYRSTFITVSTLNRVVSRIRRYYHRPTSDRITLREIVAPNFLRFAFSRNRVLDRIFELAKSARVAVVSVVSTESVRLDPTRRARTDSAASDAVRTNLIKRAVERIRLGITVRINHLFNRGPPVQGLEMADNMARIRAMEDI